jgi:isopenicillin-N epimerase
VCTVQPTHTDFMLDPDVAFLNHGSFGAVPREVFDAAVSLQREMERNPVEWLGRRAEALMADARAALAGAVGADPADVVFFPNPTTAMNMVARSLRLEPGDQIVSTDHEYGAMDRTWRHRCAATGAIYTRVPIPVPVADSNDFVERVWSAVTARTRVLFLSHITSATALVFPVAELVRRARAAGILAIVDGAHVPGHLPLDLAALDADIYTGALHKWWCAPKGCSFLWARREVQPMLQPLVVSWGWESEHPSGSDFIDFHEWQGTRDLSPFLGLVPALEFAQRHDWTAVQERGHRMVMQARGRIEALTGLEPFTGVDPAGHQWIGQMAVARLPEHVDVVALKARLYDLHRVEVPIHRWNGVPLVRVSCTAHTRESDIDRLVVALAAEIAC